MAKGWLVLVGSVAGVAMAVPAHAQAQRNYDCSKPGNANKSVCKAKAASATASAAAPTPAPAAKTRNYDCSKAGNANKAVCKAAAANAAPAPAATPAPAPTVARSAPAAPRTATGQNTNPGGPGGATAKCRDGSMSFSKHRSGTCSRHGGVAQWY